MSPAPHRPTADPQEIIADLQRELAVCRAELDQRTAELLDALEQQTAAAEVLGVINSSPGDLAPVFDSMLDKALRLCGADFGNLLRYDGKLFHVASAVHGNREIGERNRGRAPFPPPPGGLLHPILQGEDVVYVEDLLHDPAYHSVAEIREMVDRGGYRSLLNVALRKDTALLGVIGIFRKESRPFGDKQIALLHNFAAQAVIAMENVRLLTETREALEQQTATAEVLGVINSSPGNLWPVFEAMLGQAIRLCQATFGHFRTYDGEGFPLAAVRGEPALVELHRQRFGHFVPGPHHPISRLVRGERLIHIPDTAADEAYRHDPDWPQLVAAGARPVLAVALRKDDALLGYINVYREVVGPFSDKQIALLENFAAQAVIAMENARLLGQLRERTRDLEESLEYQTATSDVLKVISRSTFDLQPVLDRLVETATRLCEADLAVFANTEEDGYRVVATFSTSPEFEAFIRGYLLPKGRGSIAGRAAIEGRVVQVANLAADPEYTVREAITLQNTGTTLGVPLLREGVVVGTITLGRQRVEPFTERQIELVRTFADQAVIAIENTRLITETRESLEQQTATAEVLQVINSSPGDLAPVFDAMLERAIRLCDATQGVLWAIDGDRPRVAATYQVPADFIELRRQVERGDRAPVGGLEQIMRGERIVHFRTLPRVSRTGLATR